MKTGILRINGNGRKKITATVTDEIPLTLELDGKELLTLLCSPGDTKELSVGFLYSSGIIKSMDDIRKIVIDRRNKTSFIELREKYSYGDLPFKRMYSSGCGRGIIFYNVLDKVPRGKLKSGFKISAGKITEIMSMFEKKSSAFRETGGVHSAGLSDGKKILVFKEDIGRHNAVDKAVGGALMKELNFGNMFMLTSGRISSEIMFKLGRTGIPLVVSRGAPTDQAVKLAKELNLTLAGFVRGKRMNIYSSGGRIV